MFRPKLFISYRTYEITSSINCTRNYSQLIGDRPRNQSCLKINHPVLQKRNFSLNETVTTIWKSLSNSTPVAYVQYGLTEIHEFTGLPWWASIALSTILFRTIITLPLTIYQNKITAKLENITLEMPAIVAELKKETRVAIKKFHWSEQQARLVYNRSLKKQWNKLIVRDNCHPLKTIIVLWGQIPLWIFQSVAIRNLIYLLPNPESIDAQIIATQLTVGGFGWIPNLTDVDHSLILPVTLGLINLTIIETQGIMRTRPATKLNKIGTNFFRILSVGMIPIAATVPSALCVYWVTSSSYGLLQNLILLSPNIRRILRIPKVKSEHENPYQHLGLALQNRFSIGTQKPKEI